MPDQGRSEDSRTRPDKGAIPVAPRTLPVLSVWLRDLIISLAISAFIIIFLYQPVKVEGTSMMPALTDQERLRQQVRVTGWAIQRGDIVIFAIRESSKSFIKRDQAGGRPHPMIRARSSSAGTLEEDYVPAAAPNSGLIPRWLCLPTATVLATIAPCRRQRLGPVSTISMAKCFGYWPMDKMGRVR